MYVRDLCVMYLLNVFIIVLIIYMCNIFFFRCEFIYGIVNDLKIVFVSYWGKMNWN